MRNLRSLPLLLFTLLVSPAFAATIGVVIDENCNGFYSIGGAPAVQLSCNVSLDPLSSMMVPTFLLPTTVFGNIVVGDVEMFEPPTGISDLVRFATGNVLRFYSEAPEPGELPELSDVGIPTGRQPIVMPIMEIGLEGNNSAIYGFPTPLNAAQPGFSPGNDVRYLFISDVPEPSPIVIVSGGLALLLCGRILKKTRRGE